MEKSGSGNMKCRICKKEIPDDAVYCCYCGKKQMICPHKPKRRANGTGTIYPSPGGKGYVAEKTLGYYKGKDGKKHRIAKKKTFPKKSDAINALPNLGNDVPDTNYSPALRELYEELQGTRHYEKLSHSQQDKLRYAWNKIGKIQAWKICNLDYGTMQKMVDLGKTYYPARDIKILFSHLYKIAIRNKKEEVNLAEYLELPDAPGAKREVFTEQDRADFWVDYTGIDENNDIVCPHEFTGLILIMAYTGMRIGELCDIPKEDVHLDEHYIVGGEKTAAGIDREIPICDKIYDIVKLFYGKGKKKLVEKNIWGFYDEYWATIDRLGIRHLPPQTCRHTYFTMMAQRNVHPALIASMGGHAQYETAIDNYNRLPLKEKLDAVNKL